MRISTLLAGIAVCVPLGAQGQLSLKELVQEARARNQEILAAQKKYEGARQRPSQAGSLPDPVFSPGYNSNGNPLPGAGLGREATSMIGFTVTQEVPAPGKRRLRGEVVVKEADVLFQEYRMVELNVIARLKQAYAGLYHSYAIQDLLQRTRDQLRELLQATEARYSIGRAAQQDVFKAQAQLSLIETKLLQAARERRTREAEVNGLLDRAPGSVLGIPEEPRTEQIRVPLEELIVTAEEQAPARMREQKTEEREEAAMRLARRSYYPDYAVTGGYSNMGGLPAFYTFRVDLKIPLYYARKQRAEVTEQAQAVARAQHSYQAAGQTVRARITEQYAAAEAALELMRIYTQDVIPQANLALDSSLLSYQTGAVDFLSVLNNQLAVLEYQMNVHEEMQNYLTAMSRLEELSGVALME
jgi:cobalt-zinc-cadmium efflux system outer membrane protein